LPGAARQYADLADMDAKLEAERAARKQQAATAAR
jgi:hypothetical protein